MSAITVVTIVKYIILAYLAVHVFMLVMILTNRETHVQMMAESAINNAIDNTKSFYFSRDNLTAMMSKYGLMSMMNDFNMEPSTFLLMKFGIGGAGAIAFFTIGPNIGAKLLLAAVGGVIGFFALDFLIKESNKGDNIAMQEDIVTIYNILKIHAKAGVYITDSLIECQRSVATPRLKKALQEMNNNIFASKTTVEKAVDQFNARFDNEQIDNLSVIIRQSLRTGRSQDILADISKQITDGNTLRAQNKKDRMKRKTTVIAIIFCLLITAVVLYLVVMQMASSVKML